MIESFLNYIEFEKRYSPHTLTSYKNDLKQFTDYLSNSYQIEDPSVVSYSIVRSWLHYLGTEEKLSAKSMNRKIATIRSYYKFLLKKGSIVKNPTLKIIAPKIKKSLPTFVEEASMTNLLDQLEFSDD